METGEIKKYYEWNTTSRAGRVEVYLAEDDNTIYFESGQMVPKDRIDMELRQIDEVIYNQKSQFQSNETAPNILDQTTDWNAILGNDPALLQQLNERPVEQPTIVAPVQIVAEQNPIKIILDKQKKTQKLTLLIDFELEVPTSKVLELLDVMFEREEVIDEIIKSATEKINTPAVTDKLTESIKEKIESLFVGEENDDIKNEMQTS
jgi:hypothetical protein